MYQRIWTPHVGEKATMVAKRTRKQTQPIRSSGAQERNVVHSWILVAGNIQDSFFIGAFQLCVIFLILCHS